MTALLISGMGPEYPDNQLLRGSSFEALLNPAVAANAGGARFALNSLHYKTGGGLVLPLLRKRKDGGGARAASMPMSVDDKISKGPKRTFHLTSFTLESILTGADIDFDSMSTEHIWNNTGFEPAGEYDTVLLSTTFIWDQQTLRRAIGWIGRRFPASKLILGGQYSNLKFHQIMVEHKTVNFVIRGDAEIALPDLLRKLGKGGDIASVPNLVFRGAHDEICLTPIGYVDLDLQPSPSPNGFSPVVPYESMRGCPFTCKFCSFPAASPKWRYKSADKIARDWERYKIHNGAQYIKALDSTFTVPPTRLRSLLPKVEAIKIQWEAYTRANSINSMELVHQLENSGCSSLFMGFESMSDTTLQYMDKKVTSRANRLALELLAESSIKHFVSFIVGYPGESPELFEATRRFLVNEFSGEFALYVCMLQDETMPLWDDAEKFNIHVDDPSGEAHIWSHSGMDSKTARQLQLETLREVRWNNDNAIFRSWQHDFESPLIPDRTQQENTSLEKLVDRLGMISVDISSEHQARKLEVEITRKLTAHGISVVPSVLVAK
ncbi:hypothetical protein ALP14_200104 [Pseudomonas amygdali pv. myricae]|uniref:B12-binding domain-containing radical SAM protein n=1 Tax=Pseudomonas amygdali TaxID=47877 RepID=UPI000EFECCED|nr:radical SAM protein [Pseudomonas amygdali]RMV22217.1 hypothetical protein ALP14_200104 [Pseudomonas amygdali pv. myricae]